MGSGNGWILQIQGSVVDVGFPTGKAPAIYEALTVERKNEQPLVLEVEKLLENDVARCVSMDSTDGLQRGMSVIRTDAPISVPVGMGTLGRVLNVLGQPVDNKGPVEAKEFYPIHRPAPSFAEQSTRVEVFETGLKVIDLIAPFTKGGKTGIFGGAGVGKTIIMQEFNVQLPQCIRVNLFLPVLANGREKGLNSTAKCWNPGS